MKLIKSFTGAACSQLSSMRRERLSALRVVRFPTCAALGRPAQLPLSRGPWEGETTAPSPALLSLLVQCPKGSAIALFTHGVCSYTLGC
jgi:hypothetical protein